MEDELDMSEGSVKPKAASLGPLPYNQRHNPSKIPSAVAVIWPSLLGPGRPSFESRCLSYNVQWRRVEGVGNVCAVVWKLCVWTWGHWSADSWLLAIFYGVEVKKKVKYQLFFYLTKES